MGKTNFCALILLCCLPACGLLDSIRSPAEVQPRLTLVAGDGQSAEIGTSLQENLRVQAVDQEDNPLSAARIQFSILQGQGSFSDSTELETNETGFAEIEFTLGSEIGTVMVRAELIPNLLDDPTRRVDFAITALPATGPRLFLVGGDQQVGTIDGDLPDPLVVLAKDESGDPVAGATVEFSVVSGQATVGSPVTTDSNGYASSNATLGALEGTIEIEARWFVAGEIPTYRFHERAQSVVARVISGVEDGNGAPLCTYTNNLYADLLVVQVLGEANQKLQLATVRVDVANGYVVVGSDNKPFAEASTDSNGTATFVLRAGSVSEFAYEGLVLVSISLPQFKGISAEVHSLVVTQQQFVSYPVDTYVDPESYEFSMAFQSLFECGKPNAAQQILVTRQSQARCIPDNDESKQGPWEETYDLLTDADGKVTLVRTFAMVDGGGGPVSQFFAVGGSGGSQPHDRFTLERTACKGL
ncbi:MAG TPA: Ig-like domain-containing protein [Bdellovibrionota bacterium]|nr:Ig-like domain-containing protein [Bdellovibrionota bacterium]